MQRLLTFAVCFLLACVVLSQDSSSTPQTTSPNASSDSSVSTGSSVSTDASTSSSVSIDTSTGSSMSTNTNTGSTMSTDISTGSSVSTDASTGSSVSTDVSTGSSVSTDASTGSSVSTDASTGSSVSTVASTGSSVSTDISTGSSVSTDASTGSSVSSDISTGSSASTDISTGSTMSTDISTGSSVSTDTSTGSTVSVSTSVFTMSTDNITTDSTTGNETFVTNATTPTTTTPTTTTTKAPFDVKHNEEIARYILELKVGLMNTSDIQYYNTNFTKDNLQTMLSAYFQNVSTDVNVVNDTEDSYTLKVILWYRNLDNGTESLLSKFWMVFVNINNSMEFDLPNENATYSALSIFINKTKNVCGAMDVCPLGFSCNDQGCLHMCTSNFCNGNGDCYVTISATTDVTPICKCNSEYDIEYTGAQCEYSRRGRLQIIAIIAGVLGAACLVFIIIIIFMCVKLRRRSGSNYNLSGSAYINSAYDNHIK